MRHELYSYQKEGIQFLSTTKKCILADSPGLGKTVQSIFASLKVGKKILIVCPSTLRSNWEREFKYWAPETRVQVISGETRKQRDAQLQTTFDVLIVNWEFLRLYTSEEIEGQEKKKKVYYNLDILKKLKFDVAIYDEAHKIKNRKAMIRDCTKVLSKSIPRLFFLTGTPITNSVSDLWSLLNLIDSKVFSSYWKFINEYCYVSNNGFGVEIGPLKVNKQAALVKEIQPYVLRRTKMQELKDLPSKTIQKLYVPLEKSQQKVYDEMSKEMYTKFLNKVVSVSVVVAQITRLKQIVIDPSLMLSQLEITPLSGAKITALVDILENLEGEKVLIFSQFAEVVRRLKHTLELLKYTVVSLTGDMTSRERDSSLKEFQTNPQCQIFIISTLAGGVGLTLTEASTAIFMDKYWVPAINEQAQDRIHRLSQSKPVTIVELLAENTIEEGIEDLLQFKDSQSQALFTQDDFENSSVTSSQLLELLRYRNNKNRDTI